MRIKHKYLRNKHFWNKSWNRARAVEQPFKTFCPFWRENLDISNDIQEQIDWHFRTITEQARRFQNGARRVSMKNASSTYRRIVNVQRKAKERAAMQKIRQGEEVDIPIFKKDAAYHYW